MCTLFIILKYINRTKGTQTAKKRKLQ